MKSLELLKEKDLETLSTPEIFFEDLKELESQ